MLAACSKSPEKKAKSVIDEELRKTLHDYKSYEPVAFGKVDSSFSAYFDLPEYEDNSHKIEEATEDMKKYWDKAMIYAGSIYSQSLYKLYKSQADEAADSAKAALERNKVISENFVPVFNGYKMNHSYRAKSLSGNLGIHHYVFYFDSGITKVVRQIDISEKNDKLK